MHEATETETAELNGRSKAKNKPKRAKKTPQMQVPGTEHDASVELREMHDDYARAKYDAKGAQEIMKTLGPAILERMNAEGITHGLSSEVEFGGETRRVVTVIEPGKEKLKTTMEELDGDDE